MRRFALAVTALAAGCAPLMSPALPLPLPRGTTSAVGLAASSPRSPDGADGSVEVPKLQGQAFATFRLSEAWDAGPTILVDMNDRLGEPSLAGGLFVRWWAPAEPDAIRAGLKVELGWAWVGVGADLAFPLGAGAWFTASPGVSRSLDALFGRVPIGAIVEAGPIDAALEAGVTVGVDGQGTVGVAPWVGVKLQLRFGGPPEDAATSAR